MQITVSNSTQWGRSPTMSPCTIKRSLICRSPPQCAAHASDLLTNRPARCENLQPPGSPQKKPAPPPVSQSITATPLMYLGHKKWFTGAGAGLRNPARWIEGQAVGGQHPLPPGKSPPGYRGGGGVGVDNGGGHGGRRGGETPATLPRGGPGVFR